MRAADLPGRLPQASSGRRSAALQLLLVDCTARANSVPPKESTLAFKSCERTPPPKLPLTTVAEHDPIYPLSNPLVLTFCLAMTVPTIAQGPSKPRSHIFGENQFATFKHPRELRTSSIHQRRWNGRLSLASVHSPAGKLREALRRKHRSRRGCCKNEERCGGDRLVER